MFRPTSLLFWYVNTGKHDIVYIIYILCYVIPVIFRFTSPKSSKHILLVNFISPSPNGRPLIDSQALDKATADRHMFQQHRARKLLGQLQQQLCSIRGLTYATVAAGIMRSTHQNGGSTSKVPEHGWAIDERIQHVCFLDDTGDSRCIFFSS